MRKRSGPMRHGAAGYQRIACACCPPMVIFQLAAAMTTSNMVKDWSILVNARQVEC